MKHIFKSSAVALAVGTAMVAPAANADVSITGSVRIGGLITEGGPGEADSDFSIANLGSRFIMSASEDIGGGLTGIGRIEVGINPNNTGGGSDAVNADGDSAGLRPAGFDRTRQIWGGVAGGFGSIKVGAQYSTFYDTVTGKGDIAWWGSCFVEFSCSREPNVLKYSGGAGGLSFGASLEGVGGGEDIEELEFGLGYKFGAVKLGAAVALSDDGVDSGTLVGLSATGSFSGVGLSLVLQTADDEFAGRTDDVSVVTVTGSYANFYGLFTAQSSDVGAEQTNFTLGYQWNIAKKTLMYFEFQQWDQDVGGDPDTFVRAILKRDFTVVGS